MVHHRGKIRPDEPVVLSNVEASYLLGDLCARLDFCLPPDKQKELEPNPPSDIDDFTSAVSVAEGLDPETAPRQIYRQVRDLVAAAFDRTASRNES
jgi:hypothetical protein